MSVAVGGRRPRVAIVPEWFPSRERPVLGTFVREQARAIAPHADVAVVYCDPDIRPARGPWSIRQEDDDGLRVVRIGLRELRPRQLGTLGRVLAVDAALADLGRSYFQPDLLHAHVFSAAVPALFAGRRRRLPVVVSEHYSGVGRGALSRWDRAIARLVYSRADVVCPVSAGLGEAIERLAPRAEIRQVPNSVDTELFSAAARGPHEQGDAPRLIAVGMLTAVKGTVHLLHAFARVLQARRDVRLDIVGDGPERIALEREAATLGIATATTFHGQRAREEVAELMAHADIFVLPSLWENLPCAAIEALASGLPVVATSVGGLPELVTVDRGILVEAGNADALAEGIEEALGHFDGRDAAELAATVEARYSHEAVGREWLDVYRLAGA